jgi:hypothetical protein
MSAPVKSAEMRTNARRAIDRAARFADRIEELAESDRRVLQEPARSARRIHAVAGAGDRMRIEASINPSSARNPHTVMSARRLSQPHPGLTGSTSDVPTNLATLDVVSKRLQDILDRIMNVSLSKSPQIASGPTDHQSGDDHANSGHHNLNESHSRPGKINGQAPVLADITARNTHLERRHFLQLATPTRVLHSAIATAISPLVSERPRAYRFSDRESKTENLTPLTAAIAQRSTWRIQPHALRINSTKIVRTGFDQLVASYPRNRSGAAAYSAGIALELPSTQKTASDMDRISRSAMRLRFAGDALRRNSFLKLGSSTPDDLANSNAGRKEIDLPSVRNGFQRAGKVEFVRKRFALASGEHNADTIRNAVPLVVNYSPSVSFSATAADDIERRVTEAIGRHGGDLVRVLRRELEKRRRTEF